MRPRSRVAVERLGGLDPLAALAAPWRALWARCPDATPFQRPEWLLPFCRSTGSTPRIYAARAQGRLLGLLILNAGAPGTLTLAGAGLSDWRDALVDPEAAPDTIEALWFALAADRDWAELDLGDLPPTSWLARTPLPPIFSDQCSEHEICPMLELPADSRQLLGALPAHLAHNLRTAGRRAARLGATLELAEPATLDEHLEALFRTHRQRWATRGLAGVLATPALRDFHREVARGMLAEGRLLFCGLRLDHRIVASAYAFLGAGTVCFYLGGFEPALGALSPGSLVIAHAARAAIEAGARRLDFLRGDEPYKRHWGAHPRRSLRRRIWRVPARCL